jgi:hypothetical protein
MSAVPTPLEEQAFKKLLQFFLKFRGALLWVEKSKELRRNRPGIGDWIEYFFH